MYEWFGSLLGLLRNFGAPRFGVGLSGSSPLLNRPEFLERLTSLLRAADTGIEAAELVEETDEELAARLARSAHRCGRPDTRFADFQEGMADACHRARRLDPTGEDHLKNPSTTVWKIVENLAGPGPGA